MTISPSLQLPAPKARHFLPSDFVVTTAEALQFYLQQLLDRPIHSVADLEQLLLDDDEGWRVVSEHCCRVNLRASCDTTDEVAKAEMQRLIADFFPLIDQFGNGFREKLLENPFLSS